MQKFYLCSIPTFRYLAIFNLSVAFIYSQTDAEKHRCQKCLQYGHWTYECQNKRKYVQRESRTKKLQRKRKAILEVQQKK